MFTVKQAAERLNCSVACIYNLVAAGRLSCHRIGLRRGCIRISPAQLDAFLAETEQERKQEEVLPPLPTGTFKHLRV